MFGLSWAELAVIIIVALLVIGPQDLPPLIRAGKQGMKKLRAFKQEVGGQITALLDETELSDTKAELEKEAKAINDKMRYIVDQEGQLQETYDISDMMKKPPHE